MQGPGVSSRQTRRLNSLNSLSGLADTPHTTTTSFFTTTPAAPGGATISASSKSRVAPLPGGRGAADGPARLTRFFTVFDVQDRALARWGSAALRLAAPRKVDKNHPLRFLGRVARSKGRQKEEAAAGAATFIVTSVLVHRRRCCCC